MSINFNQIPKYTTLSNITCTGSYGDSEKKVICEYLCSEDFKSFELKSFIELVPKLKEFAFVLFNCKFSNLPQFVESLSFTPRMFSSIANQLAKEGKIDFRKETINRFTYYSIFPIRRKKKPSRSVNLFAFSLALLHSLSLSSQYRMLKSFIISIRIL